MLQVFLISEPVSHRLNWMFRPAHQLFSQFRTLYLVSGLKSVTPQVHRHWWWPSPQSWQVKKKRHVSMAKYFTGGAIVGREKDRNVFEASSPSYLYHAGLQSYMYALNSQPIP